MFTRWHFTVQVLANDTWVSVEGTHRIAEFANQRADQLRAQGWQARIAAVCP